MAMARNEIDYPSGQGTNTTKSDDQNTMFGTVSGHSHIKPVDRVGLEMVQTRSATGVCPISGLVKGRPKGFPRARFFKLPEFSSLQGCKANP